MVAKDDNTTSRIRVALQCMLRQTPNQEMRIQLRNNLSMKIAYFDLNTDIDKEIKKIKIDRDTASDSVYEAQGMHLLSKLTGLLPALITKIISLDLSKKVSLVYSKFPPLKTPLTFTGKKSKSFIISAPLLGCLNACISVVQHAGTIKIVCLSDEACISDPKLLMKMFDTNALNLLTKYTPPEIIPYNNN
jgi:hypothetical protein